MLDSVVVAVFLCAKKQQKVNFAVCLRFGVS